MDNYMITSAVAFDDDRTEGVKIPHPKLGQI